MLQLKVFNRKGPEKPSRPLLTSPVGCFMFTLLFWRGLSCLLSFPKPYQVFHLCVYMLPIMDCTWVLLFPLSSVFMLCVLLPLHARWVWTLCNRSSIILHVHPIYCEFLTVFVLLTLWIFLPPLTACVAVLCSACIKHRWTSFCLHPTASESPSLSWMTSSFIDY